MMTAKLTKQDRLYELTRHVLYSGRSNTNTMVKKYGLEYKQGKNEKDLLAVFRYYCSQGLDTESLLSSIAMQLDSVLKVA